MNNANMNSAGICTTVDTQRNLALEQFFFNVISFLLLYCTDKKQAVIVLILLAVHMHTLIPGSNLPQIKFHFTLCSGRLTFLMFVNFLLGLRC